ncbi:MAG: septal ring lytic transglycosylase RlpA family protein [Patescibacteria group bacterium]
MSRQHKITFFLGMALLVFLAIPGTALAADEQSQVLHIDKGFLGHAVKLDIAGGAARISWQAGEVVEESDINISVSSSSELGIIWSSSYAISKKGVELGLKPDFGPATSTDKWHEIVLETKKPFGHWERSKTKSKDGYLTARIGPEVQARLVVVPIGMRDGTATWYKYKKCLCAASPDFPAGTKLKVSLKDKPEKFVIVKVNDYGPDRKLFPNRVIDLDSTAFKMLSPLSAGKIEVSVNPVDSTPAVALAAK